jgi:hypothetical protein
MTALCVLTGDLVASSDLAPDAVDAVLGTIDGATATMAQWSASDLQTRFARRGGDSWQIALTRPELGLRAALFILALLRRDHDLTETRIAIATGSGVMPDTGDLNAAHGAAFTASGRLLTEISGHGRLAHAQGGALHATARLADHIASGWTQAQARAIAAALPPDAPPRADIAKSFGITRQAVNQALWSAGYPALDEALRAIEDERRK